MRLARRRDTSENRRIGARSAILLLFALVYLLFVGQLAWPEVVAALASSGAAVVATVAVQRNAPLRYAVSWSWLRKFSAVPGHILVDSARLGSVLWRLVVGRKRTAGRFLLLPFDSGADDPYSRARRALVIAGVSIAPNTYVVEVERAEESILLHQLARHDLGRLDLKWPL